MADTVRFFLNGALHEVANPDPTLTVLDYVRGVCRLTGTKEGCAEGDCGACTVAVAERGVAQGAYRAVNACIMFLPILDGKDVLTVEGLAESGRLHPVQQALVDHHGSQCGFCTPGFVMSLFAHYARGGEARAAALAETLSGNLCRCTGYGPIFAAGEAMYGYPPPADRLAASARAERLARVSRDTSLALAYRCPHTGALKRFFAPRTLEELAALALAHPDAVFLAGGTDVGLWVTKQHRTLATLIHVGAVAELRSIVETEGHIEIGAAVPLTDAIVPVLRHYPQLATLFARYGGLPVRNCATLGGNIANGSPIGDSLPPLIALGTRIVLRHGAAVRTLPLEDFFLAYGKQDRAPGELVERIVIPKPAPGQHLYSAKIAKRVDQDISALCGAFMFGVEAGRITQARIAFGGMAATPKRARATEAALAGAPFTESTARRAMAKLGEDFRPITDFRASADYRLEVAGHLLLKAVLGAAAPDLPGAALGKREGAGHGE